MDRGGDNCRVVNSLLILIDRGKRGRDAFKVKRMNPPGHPQWQGIGQGRPRPRTDRIEERAALTLFQQVAHSSDDSRSNGRIRRRAIGNLVIEGCSYDSGP